MSGDSSAKSPAAKLGIKNSFQLAIINPPFYFVRSLDPLPKGAAVRTKESENLDMVIYFSRSKKGLEDNFPALKKQLAPEGMIWVAWQKPAGSFKSDLNEKAARATGLSNGMVDTGSCAIFEGWLALKFVLPEKGPE